MRHLQRTREKVIKEFRRVGRVDLACAAAGVDRTTHYWWMKNDPEYRKSFEEAREEACGLLEDEAVHYIALLDLRPPRDPPREPARVLPRLLVAPRFAPLRVPPARFPPLRVPPRVPAFSPRCAVAPRREPPRLLPPRLPPIISSPIP